MLPHLIFNCMLNGDLLCRVSEAKDLGVLFDAAFYVYRHVVKVVVSASKMLKTLFYSFAPSNLEYDSLAFYPIDNS